MLMLMLMLMMHLLLLLRERCHHHYHPRDIHRDIHLVQRRRRYNDYDHVRHWNALNVGVGVVASLLLLSFPPDHTVLFVRFLHGVDLFFEKIMNHVHQLFLYLENQMVI